MLFYPLGQTTVDWVQNYDPLGQPFLSTLMAASPVVVLLTLLVLGWHAHRAALAGLGVAIGVANFGFGMPLLSVIAAALYGAAFGLMPIGWIVIAAVFLYRLTVVSGQFDIVKQSVASISPDHRIQALLIAFSFGSFIEGAAGFGTPVAISAALLIGLGFPPLLAAGIALIANTSPVAFGALGTPIIVLADVSGLDEMALSRVAGRQLPLFSLLIPAWLVVTMSGFKGLRGCWPAVVVCGGSFSILQFVMSNYHGPTLVDVVGGLGSLVITACFLKVWKPKEIWRLTGESNWQVMSRDDVHAQATDSEAKATRAVYWKAWVPWALLSLMVLLWGWPAIKTELNGGTSERPNFLQGVSVLSYPVPALDKRVYRVAPVANVAEGKDRAEKGEEAVYRFNWLSATGTGIFLAAWFSVLWLRIPWRIAVVTLRDTLFRLQLALLTIACMLALAYVTKYSGADATLGLAFTKTGSWYPFFAPLLGWLGVALTGSDTSSNAMFGSLQRITAEQLQLDPTLIVASNSTGGVMGKMIDAQSIVVAAVATEQTHGEGKILKFVFWHSVVLALLMGLLCLVQSWL
jgi:lactate permease